MRITEILANPPADPQLDADYSRRRLAALRSAKYYRDRGRRILRYTAIAAPVAFVIALFWSELIPDKLILLIIPPVYLFIIVVLSYLLSPRDLEREIERTEREIDLSAVDVAEEEKRAEKLFRLHQLELDEYYSQTLRHSAWIFAMGILCLVIGFAIVGATLYLIAGTFKSQQAVDKLVIASLGGISSLLSGYIGSIYLGMYSATVRSLNEFHNRLVFANRLHFGNYLTAKIQDQPVREQTLAAMALQLASCIGLSPAGAAGSSDGNAAGVKQARDESP